MGTWSFGASNYDSAPFFGDKLMLPAADYRISTSGASDNRGLNGDYWSSSVTNSGNPWDLYFYSGFANAYDILRLYGFSVRYVAE